MNKSGTREINTVTTQVELCSACDMDLHEFCFGHCKCRSGLCDPIYKATLRQLEQEGM